MTERGPDVEGRRPASGRTVHRVDPDGTVRDWLVSPVWSRPCLDLDQVLDAEGEPWGPTGRWVLTNGPDVAPLKRRLLARHPMRVEQAPVEFVEGGQLTWDTTGGPRAATWSRRHVARDGFVDWSEFCFTPEYREAVAATRLEVDQAEERVIEVWSTGPFRCWVGGRLVLQHDAFSYMEPQARSVRVRLPSGTTDVVVSTWQVAFRECRHILRMRVLGLPVRVVIPNPTADEYRSSVAERVLQQVGSRSWALDGPTAELIGPPGTALRVTVDGRATHRVRIGPDGTAHVPVSGGKPDPADTVQPVGASPATEDGDKTASASMLTTGETALDVRLDDEATPVPRQLFVARLPEHRTHPTGGPEQWKQEVLEHVAQHRGSTAAALARSALSPNAAIDGADLETALTRIRTRGDCADFEVLGLMHLWHRLPPAAWPAGLREQVEHALVGMKYWITQPGLDAMCYFTENHQLVWHVAQRLAGSAWRDRRFQVDGRTGADHAEEGGRRAAAWIRRKLDGGFSEFDSNAYLAIDALALVSLVELDEDDDLRSAAEALLDKMLLSLASNSWRGVHGAAHGRSYVQTLRSSRLEETAPILWLLAGVGALNEAVLPVTALATARRYRAPEIICRLASGAGSEPTKWWGRQVYRGDYAFERDLLSRPYGSDLRVWRTPGAMLSSVQDYRSGLPGLQEHIWGATLGPEVQVFATHPANSDNGSSARPNAWAGQRVLPHARQDRDVVLVVHAFPAGDPEARTHLWLPIAHCDQWCHHGSWVAARVDTGFVAVATPGGLKPAQAGDTSWQEWTPVGPGTAWVATVGWAGPHGADPADAFDRWVSQLGEPVEDDRRLSWTAPDGRAFQLSWDGTFIRNGEAVDLDTTGLPEHPPHLDNPSTHCRFGDRLLEAEWAGERLVLDLHAGRRLVPSSGVGTTSTSVLSEVTNGR